MALYKISRKFCHEIRDKCANSTKAVQTVCGVASIREKRQQEAMVPGAQGLSRQMGMFGDLVKMLVADREC